MASISELYPRRGFLNAEDVEHGDLVLQIASFEKNGKIGHNRTGNILHFANDERTLVLNHTNAHMVAALYGDETDAWSGKWITLFYDPTVTYGDEIKPGIRVRSFVPQAGDGSALPTAKPKPSLDDEIPF